MRCVIMAVLLSFFSIIALPGAAVAGSEDIVVEKPWARASIGPNRPGAAYLTLRNTGSEAIALVGLSTPIAMKLEVHETTTSSAGVSSMAPAGEIKIDPGESVALEPGGLHVMLMRLQAPLTKGESFPLTLSFSDGNELVVDVPILSFGARGPEG